MAQQKKTTRKKLCDPEPFPNDPLEWAIILVAGLGVGGGIFALLYLAKLNGAI